MIRKIEINNFKSIVHLPFELGRFNVFIGENGCGKSNILEAIAMGAAACAGKLDTEFLSSRGIRVTLPKLMRAGFNPANTKDSVRLTFKLDHVKGHFPDIDAISKEGKLIISKNAKSLRYDLQNKNEPYSSWYDLNKEALVKNFPNFLTDLIIGNLNEFPVEIMPPKDRKQLKAIRNLFKNASENEKKQFSDAFKKIPLSEFSKDAFSKELYDEHLSNFLIFSPENSFLRKFEDEEKIQPLGIKGEGLFKLLNVLDTEDGKKTLKEIKEHLRMLDWFLDFEIPKSKKTNANKEITLQDKYLHTSEPINQQSANEGFLFLLFYLALFISKDTPSFFAIDNIEASFNPKLCSQVTKTLYKLSVSYNKQAIVTTHNPYILDGLDLKDPEQKLFVVRRNMDGNTILTPIIKGKSKRKLSEAWMLGYLGGLPNNF